MMKPGCCSGSVPKPDFSGFTKSESKVAAVTYKIVFLGASGVGKTCMSLRFSGKQFQTNIDATVGAVFSTMNVQSPSKKNDLVIEMWDTAGQERFRALTPIYYRVADAAILVYDITDLDSFDSLKQWYQELQENVSDCLVMIAGNKLDKEGDRAVNFGDASRFAAQRNCYIMEVSSKTGQNIPEFTDKLCDELLSRPPRKTIDKQHPAIPL